MRLETKFVQVPNDPEHINAINNLAAVWGWTVQNIQVTDSKITYEGDSHGWVTDYGYYGTTERITEHTNYASITYQRDMDNPKYEQLTALEDAYNSCTGKQYLTQEEQQRLSNAKLAVDAKRSKLIIYGMVALIGSIVLGIILRSVFEVSFFGLVAMGNYLLKRSKVSYETDSNCRTILDLYASREAAEKQSIIKQAKSI